MTLKALVRKIFRYYMPAGIAYIVIFSNFPRCMIRLILDKSDSRKILYLRKKLSKGSKIGFQVDSLLHAGHFSAVYFRQEYRALSVEGKTVIDVGAANGDTAIYFYLRGATQIIAVESNVKSYLSLCNNVSLNKLGNRIKTLNCAVGRTKGTIRVDPDVPPSPGNSPKEHEGGIPIDIITLEDLIENISNPMALKLDCEGCEFDAILGSSLKVLSRFDEIFMEFHGNPFDIAKRLQEAGFRTEYEVGKTIGYLHARNKNPDISNMSL